MTTKIKSLTTEDINKQIKLPKKLISDEGQEYVVILWEPHVSIEKVRITAELLPILPILKIENK